MMYQAVYKRAVFHRILLIKYIIMDVSIWEGSAPDVLCASAIA